KRSTTLPSSYCCGSPTLNLLGGSESTLGKRNRMVPSVMASMLAMKAVQATANQLPNIVARKNRRLLTGGLAGALAGAGLAAGGGAVAGPALAAPGVASDIIRELS